MRIIGRPTIAGNIAVGKLSPANPALTYCAATTAGGTRSGGGVSQHLLRSASHMPRPPRASRAQLSKGPARSWQSPASTPAPQVAHQPSHPPRDPLCFPPLCPHAHLPMQEGIAATMAPPLAPPALILPSRHDANITHPGPIVADHHVLTRRLRHPPPPPLLVLSSPPPQLVGSPSPGDRTGSLVLPVPRLLRCSCTRARPPAPPRCSWRA